MIWVEWVEPFGEGGSVFLRVTKDTAIAYQKAFGEKLGKPYTSDDAALQDFIETHWASLLEE